MLKHKKSIFIILLAAIMVSTTAFAHSGRTDASGGHNDNQNASGLGYYHFHHGYPAHLHPNGVCPYRSASSSSSSNSSSSSSSSISSQIPYQPVAPSVVPKPTAPANNMYAERNTMTVYVNGQKITDDNFLYNGITYIPIRSVADALNATINYVDSTKTANIVTNNIDTLNNMNYKVLYEGKAKAMKTSLYLYQLKDIESSFIPLVFTITPTYADKMDKDSFDNIFANIIDGLNFAVSLRNEIYANGETSLYNAADSLIDVCDALYDYFAALDELVYNENDDVYDDYKYYLENIFNNQSSFNEALYNRFKSLKD